MIRSSLCWVRVGRPRVWRLALVTSLAVAIVLGSVSARPASAATVAVNCTADSGALAAALATASDGDILSITGTCDGTFDISHSLTLQGSGGATLDGRRASTVVVQIDAGMTVVLTNLSITGGFLSGGGACPGGGVANHGTVTLSDVTISGNQTDYGVCNDVGATFSVIDTTISGNGSAFGGAGLLNNGTMTLTKTLVTGNAGAGGSVGGGIVNNGALTISDSTISGNSGGEEGGGIWTGGTLTLIRSTVGGNTASFSGGGIFDRGPVTITNSTVSGNTATGLGAAGGGIYNFVGGDLTLTNSTVSGNSASAAGGILTQIAATTTLKNTIIAGQTSGGNCAGVGSIQDGGYNVADDASCALSAASNSLPNTNPLLDPAGLQNNGGPTQTIGLEDGSPAANAIPREVNGCGTTITTDQRGISRPQGAGCDIGSFEVEVPVPPGADLSITKSAAPSPVVSGNRLTYTLTATNNGPQDATGVTLTDPLPANVHFNSVTSSQGTCSRSSTTNPAPKGGTVTCKLGDLANGAKASITIVVTATTPGTLGNTANVSGTEPDSDASDNSATATTTVVGT